MKLVKKERIGGKVKRKYDTPKTPYQRLMESGQTPKETKRKLKAIYLSLNPAQLRRDIEAKLDRLWQINRQKKRSQRVIPLKKQKPRRVTNYMIQQELVGLPT